MPDNEIVLMIICIFIYIIDKLFSPEANVITIGRVVGVCIIKTASLCHCLMLEERSATFLPIHLHHTLTVCMRIKYEFSQGIERGREYEIVPRGFCPNISSPTPITITNFPHLLPLPRVSHLLKRKR